MPRAPKHCGRAGCDELVTGRRYCPLHTAEHQQRSNTTQRGYGAAHQHARAAALRQLIPGTPCPHCAEPMLPSQRLDLDHTPDRTAYRGLAHARCNARDGGLRRANC